MDDLEIKKTYYPNGQIQREESYIKTAPPRIPRILHGLNREWYENGALAWEGNFKNGAPHGPNRHWFENGVLASEVNFKEGVPDGIGKQWDRTGKLILTYEIKDGTGIQKSWYAEQGIGGETSWVKGTWTGRQRTYERNGTIVGDTYWIKNRQVSKKRYVEACKTDPTLPRYAELEKAAPKVKVPKSKDRKSEDGDELAKSILSRKDVFEALKWLKDTSVLERSLGEATTQGDSIELVESLYKAGAATVWVFDICGKPSEEQNSGRLLVELPDDLQKRQTILAKCSEIGAEQGFRAETDSGQHYVILMLD